MKILIFFRFEYLIIFTIEMLLCYVCACVISLVISHDFKIVAVVVVFQFKNRNIFSVLKRVFLFNENVQTKKYKKKTTKTWTEQWAVVDNDEVNKTRFRKPQDKAIFLINYTLIADIAAMYFCSFKICTDTVHFVCTQWMGIV